MAVATESRPGIDERFEALVLDFLAYMEFERGLARNTLSAYRTDLLQYGEFLHRHGVGPTEAKPADVSEFLAELATARPVARPRRSTARPPACAPSTATCAARRSSPTTRRRTSRLRGAARSFPHVLGMGEVKRLLESANGSDAIALRDRALLEVMYACGLRASEATGLEVTDADLRRGFVRAHGKGSKERIVPLGREAAAASAPLPEPRPPGARRGERRAQALRELPRRLRSPARASTRSSAATRATRASRAR